jgi:hypothetical protein
LIKNELHTDHCINKAITLIN